jgi:hypothetical protein
VLSANTAFADFPRLSAVIAQDGYMPRQLANRGDRLAFSNGIIVLALVSGALLAVFDARVSSLVPLFAVGLFTGFTLSQAGMVVRHRRQREPGWRAGLAINLLGAVATAVVLVVVLASKLTSGAWVPALVIPAISGAFVIVHRHYSKVAAALALRPSDTQQVVRHTVIVLVSRPTRAAAKAVRYAVAMRPDHLFALTVVHDPAERAELEEAWRSADFGIPLEIVEDPYRDLTESVLRYVEEADARFADDTITVVIPEFVVSHWWEHGLHNQSALVLKARLLYRPNTVVTSVPWHLD